MIDISSILEGFRSSAIIWVGNGLVYAMPVLVALGIFKWVVKMFFKIIGYDQSKFTGSNWRD